LGAKNIRVLPCQAPGISAAYSLSHESRFYLTLDIETFVNLAELVFHRFSQTC
jgi:hypothetical protein